MNTLHQSYIHSDPRKEKSLNLGLFWPFLLRILRKQNHPNSNRLFKKDLGGFFTIWNQFWAQETFYFWMAKPKKSIFTASPGWCRYRNSENTVYISIIRNLRFTIIRKLRYTRISVANIYFLQQAILERK